MGCHIGWGYEQLGGDLPMIKKLIGPIVAFVATLGFAEYKYYTWTTDSPSTTTTNAVVTRLKYPNGKLSTVSVGCDTNVTVTLVTKAGGGLSLGGERTIFGPTAVGPTGLTTNIADTIVLYNEGVELRTKSSSTSSNVVTVGIATLD
jgi:hypothetical protein